MFVNQELQDLQAPEGWEIQRRPLGWSKRFEFADYAQTRQFLDLLTGVSEKLGYYPNLNFAKTYVVVAIQFEGDAVEPERAEFAAAAEHCAEQARE
ncbi:hypothetical protein HAP95_02735 [Acidithiobacillus sp. RW2]|uniref:4a-hydroxytetrahydrobiopterin dehydratase n=1 Tax=Acidithiobacillus sulfurivorans TaxID=1958756 RepID=A0ABS5ZVP4_9PROT|nr:hypothetical protein [Acidithiobacillus sulfurivorans]